jgi:SAM-dependent methyltransferase
VETERGLDLPREPHARALRDYFLGETDASLIVHNSNGEHDELPVSFFFRGPGDYLAFERAALELCRGRVLDVGAGAGVHALYLQEHGVEVCAIDVMPEAVEIMRQRGVRDARVADIGGLEGEVFDTILMMMNGIGILGTLDGLDRFLRDLPRLLAPGGQVLLDSGPARIVGDADDPAIEVTVTDEGIYPGEAWIELEYKGERGPPFRELYADSETLAERSANAGWECEIVFRDEHGGYVARLTRRLAAHSQETR